MEFGFVSIRYSLLVLHEHEGHRIFEDCIAWKYLDKKAQFLAVFLRLEEGKTQLASGSRMWELQR